VAGKTGHEWARDIADELRKLSNVMLLPRTTVLGNYDHNVTTLLQTGKNTAWRECLWTVRPKKILLASGAIEQGMIFQNNDRPGIMLAGAVRHYLNRYAVVSGNKAVLTTNNDTAYQTVFDLARARTPVSTVVDTREQVSAEIRQRLADNGTALFTGARISNTRGTRGIREVNIERLDGSSLGTLECDLLAVSGGWSPRVHLLAHAGGKLKFDKSSQSFLPGQLPTDFAVAGQIAWPPRWMSLHAFPAISARHSVSIIKSLQFQR